MSAFTPINPDGPLSFTAEEAASVLFGLKDASTKMAPTHKVIPSSGRQDISSSEPVLQCRSDMIDRPVLPSLSELGLDRLMGKTDFSYTTQLTRPQTPAMQKAERNAKQSLAVIAKKGPNYGLKEVNTAARHQTWNTYQDRFPRAAQEEKPRQASNYRSDSRLMMNNSKAGSSKLIEAMAQRDAQPASQCADSEVSVAGSSKSPSSKRGGYDGVQEAQRAEVRAKAHADNDACQAIRNEIQYQIAEKNKDKCSEEQRELYEKRLSTNKKYQEAAKQARNSTSQYYMGIDIDNFTGTHPEHRHGAEYNADDVEILIQEKHAILRGLLRAEEQAPSSCPGHLSPKSPAAPEHLATLEWPSSTETPEPRIRFILGDLAKEVFADASPERNAAPASNPEDVPAVQTMTREGDAIIRSRKQSSDSTDTSGTATSNTSVSATCTSATASPEAAACTDIPMQDAPLTKPITNKKTSRAPLPTYRPKRALPAESREASGPPTKKAKIKKEITPEFKARQAALQRDFDQAKVYQEGMTGLEYVHKVLDAKQALLDHHTHGRGGGKSQKVTSKSTDNEKKLMDRILVFNHENPRGPCEPCRRFGFEKCYVRPDEGRPVGVDIRCHHCARSKASILSCNNGTKEERDAVKAKAHEARLRKAEKEMGGRSEEERARTEAAREEGV